jgi:hypothetical protein
MPLSGGRGGTSAPTPEGDDLRRGSRLGRVRGGLGGDGHPDLERGGNFIDTANIYTSGHSGKILGDYFIARPGLRDRVVLGTT